MLLVEVSPYLGKGLPTVGLLVRTSAGRYPTRSSTFSISHEYRDTYHGEANPDPDTSKVCGSKSSPPTNARESAGTRHTPESDWHPQDGDSFSNVSVTSPTSQLILQPFRRFTYVIAHSPTLPLLHLRHSSFSNPSSASPTSQALHLRQLARRPCIMVNLVISKEKKLEISRIKNDGTTWIQ